MSSGGVKSSREIRIKRAEEDGRGDGRAREVVKYIIVGDYALTLSIVFFHEFACPPVNRFRKGRKARIKGWTRIMVGWTT